MYKQTEIIIRAPTWWYNSSEIFGCIWRLAEMEWHFYLIACCKSERDLDHQILLTSQHDLQWTTPLAACNTSKLSPRNMFYVMIKLKVLKMMNKMLNLRCWKMMVTGCIWILVPLSWISYLGMTWRMDKFKICSNVPWSISIKFPLNICSTLLYLHQNDYCGKKISSHLRRATFAWKQNAQPLDASKSKTLMLIPIRML